MKHKEIPYRIHQRERLISKRLHTLKEAWGESLEDLDGAFGHEGHYDKNKLGCSCWMCSKCSKTWFAGPKISEQRKILREKDEE